MRKIRICVGSNDGITISTTHLGDTECFYIYDIFENTGSKLVEKRDNGAKALNHATSSKMKIIISQISDAELLIAQHKSPNFIKIAQQTKHQPVIVKIELIEKILTLIQSEFANLYSYVERRRNGEVFSTIPELLSGNC